MRSLAGREVGRPAGVPRGQRLTCRPRGRVGARGGGGLRRRLRGAVDGAPDCGRRRVAGAGGRWACAGDGWRGLSVREIEVARPIDWRPVTLRVGTRFTTCRQRARARPAVPLGDYRSPVRPGGAGCGPRQHRGRRGPEPPLGRRPLAQPGLAAHPVLAALPPAPRDCLPGRRRTVLSALMVECLYSLFSAWEEVDNVNS